MKNMRNLYKQINRSDVISFDVFDTLVLRPYIKPVDLFLHMEKCFCADGFFDARINAERTARAKSLTPEISIDDIYANIDEKYKKYKTKEIDFELQVLQPNNEIKKIYDYALIQGKKVIIASDMYLPYEIITKILHKNGYKNYNVLYLSSKHQKTKYAGDLYDLIKQDFNTVNILHIGDNHHSDYIQPLKHGLKSFSYTKPIERFINDSPRIQNFVMHHPDNVFASILVGVLSLCKQNMVCNNFWEKIGLNYAGPSIYTYAYWLDMQFNNDNIDDALFIARDGYSLQKVYEIIKTHNKTKSHYLYAPRILNLICNLDFESQLSCGGLVAADAISTIVDYFKNADCFKHAVLPDKSDTEKQIEFVKNHLQEYKKLSAKEKSKYSSYLKQHKLTGNKRIGVIDTVSGFLTSQKFIESFIDTKTKGYYWFIWPHTDTSKHDVSTLQSEKNNLFRIWDIMEFFMTAPTPPIQNVVNNVPQYKKVSQYEQTRIDIYPYVSNGAVEFAKMMKRVFADIKTYPDYMTLIDWVNGFMDMPTDEDKKHFIKIKHAYDSNHTQFRTLFPQWYVQTPHQKHQPRYKLVKQHHFIKFIPTITEKQKVYSETRKYLLFNFLPLWKRKRKNNVYKYYLFGIVPLFTRDAE